MTNKQERIVEAALELFAEEGFRPTSTKRVAKHADVSEALIFRHFVNKDGLLAAIVHMGEEAAKKLFAEVLEEENPTKVVEKFLDLASQMQKDPISANFWKLQYKIKWEMEAYGAEKIRPVEEKLMHAFNALGVSEPHLMARRLLLEMDGLAMRFYLDPAYPMAEMIDYLKRTYLN